MATTTTPRTTRRPALKKPASRKAKPSRTRNRKAAEEECPHCKSGAESFRYFKGAYKFDVDLARQIVGDGRKAVELDPDDVRHSVDISRIYPQHLPHVSTEFPGIIAHIWGPGPRGRWLHGHLLIDGHHRAARCLQLKLPYKVYLLSEKESEQVLIHGPISRRRTKPAPKSVS